MVPICRVSFSYSCRQLLRICLLQWYSMSDQSTILCSVYNFVFCQKRYLAVLADASRYAGNNYGDK